MVRPTFSVWVYGWGGIFHKIKDIFKKSKKSNIQSFPISEQVCLSWLLQYFTATRLIFLIFQTRIIISDSGISIPGSFSG